MQENNFRTSAERKDSVRGGSAASCAAQQGGAEQRGDKFMAKAERGIVSEGYEYLTSSAPSEYGLINLQSSAVHSNVLRG